MNFFKNLFAGSKPISVVPASSSDSTRPGVTKPSAKYNERDNAGTRYDSYDRVLNFGTLYVVNRPGFPFIFYDMPSREEAFAAMRSLPPIKTAAETGKLIGTEPLEFGVYPLEDRSGRWGFFFAGNQITAELFALLLPHANGTMAPVPEQAIHRNRARHPGRRAVWNHPPAT